MSDSHTQQISLRVKSDVTKSKLIMHNGTNVSSV